MRAIYCRYSPVLKEFTSRHLPPRFSALGATPAVFAGVLLP